MNLRETLEYLERVTVSDLIGKRGNDPQISDLTAKFKGIRQATLGKEKNLASCDHVGLSTDGKDIMFVFTTPAESADAQRVNAQTFALEPNPKGIYTIILSLTDGIEAVDALNKSKEPEEEVEEEPEEEPETEEEFHDVKDQVTDSRSEEDEEEYDELKDRPMGEDIYESYLREDSSNEITEQDIIDLIEVCDAKIWSDDPSTTYQGHNYYLTQIDGSLYPNEIKPKKWDKYHNDDNFMGKHTASILQSLSSYHKSMAQKLTVLLKKKGIL